MSWLWLAGSCGTSGILGEGVWLSLWFKLSKLSGVAVTKLYLDPEIDAKTKNDILKYSKTIFWHKVISSLEISLTVILREIIQAF